MTYSQYRLKLSKLSRLYRNAYRNGAILKHSNNGDYVHCPCATSWATKYFRSRMKAHRDAYPHHGKRFAIEALT
jgi:hypothetical protein